MKRDQFFVKVLFVCYYLTYITLASYLCIWLSAWNCNPLGHSYCNSHTNSGIMGLKKDKRSSILREKINTCTHWYMRIKTNGIQNAPPQLTEKWSLTFLPAFLYCHFYFLPTVDRKRVAQQTCQIQFASSLDQLRNVGQKQATRLLHTSVLPGLVILAKTWHNLPELSQIWDIRSDPGQFEQHDPCLLWKNGTESDAESQIRHIQSSPILAACWS